MSTTTIPSKLTQGPDFASELLLNRIMNGQAEPASGRTVRAASRALAANLDASCESFNLLAENAAMGKATVAKTQNALTELLDAVKTFREKSEGLEDTELQPIIAATHDILTKILDTEDNGTKILASSQGQTVTIGEEYFGNPPDKLTICDNNIANTRAVKDLLDNMANGTLDSSNATSLADAAIEQIIGAIATEGAKMKILDDRYTLLNDLTLIYHMGSDNAAKQDKASDDTLLSVVI